MRIVLLSLLVLMPLAIRAQSLTLVADDWCPYNCDPSTGKQGFMVDVAKLAFEKHGITVNYKLLPWARAIEQGRSGKIDGIIGAYKDDAPDYVFPSLPITFSNNEFYVLSGDPWKFNGIDSLKSVALGVILDYAYGKELDKYIKENKNNAARVQAVAGDNALETNIKKLLAGRIKVVLEDGKVMAYSSKRLSLAGKISSAGNFEGDKVYIAFSPNKPDSAKYAKILSDEIALMEKEGKLKEILASYGTN